MSLVISVRLLLTLHYSVIDMQSNFVFIDVPCVSTKSMVHLQVNIYREISLCLTVMGPKKSPLKKNLLVFRTFMVYRCITNLSETFQTCLTRDFSKKSTETYNNHIFSKNTRKELHALSVYASKSLENRIWKARFLYKLL